MKTFARALLLAPILAVAWALPAAAQTPSGLAAPPKPVDRSDPSKPPAHPAPKKPLATPKPPPVVQSPANVHARKPPAIPAKPPAPVAVPPPPAPAPETAAETGKGSVTGLPTPRFVSLRSNEVNLRSGPGTRYPVDWQYRRQDLPVQIEREFDVWRLIEDQDGVKGWVNQATLVGRRSFVVTGAARTLRGGASEQATPVAILKPGVIGRIRSCEAGKAWCEMQVGEYRGWLKRDEVFGVYPNEAVGG